MDRRGLLKEEFHLKFSPPMVALRTFLRHTSRFNNDKVVLTVVGGSLQIKADIPDHPSLFALEVDLDVVRRSQYLEPCSVRFSASDWAKALEDLVPHHGDSSMMIRKGRNCSDLNVQFGGGEAIVLGKVEFIPVLPREAVEEPLEESKGVTLSSSHFIRLFKDVSSKMQDARMQDAIVEFSVSRSSIDAVFDQLFTISYSQEVIESASIGYIMLKLVASVV